MCKSCISSPFFDGGKKPLATLGWPPSEQSAMSMELYELNYVQCLRCSHIWNRSFDYNLIPYEDNPNRMFNSGILWREYLKSIFEHLASILPPKPIIIDIGCGEGHFVRELANTLKNDGRFIGFDPNSSNESGAGIEFHPQYFSPLQHLPEYQPDLLIMRHVLEHLENPAEFIEELAIASLQINKPIYFFAEVPCVDLAVKFGRIVDFFYEHPSQFTKRSFKKLMKLGGELKWIDLAYGNEVVHGLIEIGLNNRIKNELTQSIKFKEKTKSSLKTMAEDLSMILAQGNKVVVWGGTGKSATFIQHYKLDKERFPLVVDSDPSKVGSFVPGSGQEIRHASELNKVEIEIIILTTQWRAGDIYREIKDRGIRYQSILVEYGGRLVDYELDDHPY